MNSHDVFCPDEACPARGRCGEGNIWIHSRTPPRYRCTVCGKTFGARVGTPFYRRHTDEATMTTVLTLRRQPPPRWRPDSSLDAARSRRRVARATIALRGRLCGIRRGLSGDHPHPCTPHGTTGTTPAVSVGGGVIGQVVKQRAGHRVVAVMRRLVHGTEAELARLLPQGQQIHTAYIERLNATFRARLGTLTRRTRGLARRTARLHAGMYLLGTVYNLCTPHISLRTLHPQTPAMAAGITDHVWSVGEMLHYPVPPIPWKPPRQRGRRSKEMQRLIVRWCA